MQDLHPLHILLNEVGEAHGGKSPSQVALNWIVSKGVIPIPGATSPQHLESNVGSLGWQINEDEARQRSSHHT